MLKIVFFGTGGLARFLYRYKRDNVSVEAFLSSFEYGYYIEGIPVVSVKDVNKYEYDYVVIAFSDIEKGKKILSELGVEKEKMIGYHYNGAYDYNENPYQVDCDTILQDGMHSENIEKIFCLTQKKYYLCSMNIPEEKNVIENDFVREQTLALLAKEIDRKNVEGACAELGVFRGMFAKKINYLFPERILYLFDTFEGFADIDFKNDVSLNWGNFRDAFKDTAVEKVKELMCCPEKVKVKKGYFPETFDLKNEVFAFVSIDADLYDPIKSGLEIFYPRLSKGGYIMVHDYNNIVYGGAMRAVQEYCDKNLISYVPIPDVAGSIIITK